MTTTDGGVQAADDLLKLIADLRERSNNVTSDEEARSVTSRIATAARRFRVESGIGLPSSPLLQAQELDSDFKVRGHLSYLSDRLANAVRDVERGKSRFIAVSMPPRAGKSTLVSYYTPMWLLRRHPEWSIITASYDALLTAGWARNIRRVIEDKPDLGIAIASDSGAGTRWETVEGGGIFSTSVRGALTGRGARVMLIDDPIRDFVEAHSPAYRQNLWDWWLSVAQTRLEPPFLCIVVMTRWHEDDMIGRLLSSDHEGDPRDWEYVRMPAIAEGDDVLGREVGEPLIAPMISENVEQAIDRWDSVRRTVGSYTFSSMYQQRPAPAKGAIFDTGWWRYWTFNADKVTDDGRVVYIDPEDLVAPTWCDSWDCAFKGGTTDAEGGWTVGQRWVRSQGNRYMIAQLRGRISFTQTIERMKKWARVDDFNASPYGHLVHDRLIEDRANGPAIINTLRDTISGIKPINPTSSKEARARAVTPEVESGNVFLPLPSDAGNEWVHDLLSELRNFPNDAADDQVDALTQALSFLRDSGRGGLTVPGKPNLNTQNFQVPRNIAQTALRDLSRRRY